MTDVDKRCPNKALEFFKRIVRCKEWQNDLEENPDLRRFLETSTDWDAYHPHIVNAGLSGNGSLEYEVKSEDQILRHSHEELCSKCPRQLLDYYAELAIKHSRDIVERGQCQTGSRM